MRKVNELTIDSIDEVSGVDRPAQPGARAVIFKRHDPSTPSPDNATLPVHKNTPGDAGGQPQPTNMSNTNQPAELPADVTKRLTDLAAELVVAKAMAEFSDAEKAIYKGLKPEDQESFRKLSPEQRAERVRAQSESNPIVATIDGVNFRKSDDPRMIQFAKEASETRATLALVNAERVTDGFKKRAGAELAGLPGDEIAKVALLRVVESITDEPVRKAVLAILKAGNDAIGKSFKEIGAAGGDAPAGSAAEAHAKLEGIAKGLREKDTKLTEPDAYVKATELHPELYEQAVGSTAQEN